MGFTSPSSGSPTPVETEFGCRPRLIASLPVDSNLDGCDDACTGGGGSPTGAEQLGA